jgi:predicted nucleic acid-binding Zn ribbon protein
MSFGGRARERARTMRWAYGIAAALVVVALLFLLNGHWILGIVFGVAAVLAVSVVLQLRQVR